MAIGTDGQVRRSCSGRLRISGRVEPVFIELVTRLREQYGEKSIEGVQSFGRGRFELLFAKESILNIAAEQGFFFDNQRHDIEPVDTPVKWLFVKYAPFELDSKDFEKHLAPYGEVLSVDFFYPEEIKPWHNGERKIKFVMKKEVPNFVKIGMYTVQIRYSGVVSLCRKCHGSGHVAKFCKNNKCRRCGNAGHLEAECRNELEDGLSPGMQKIVEQARDDLLENLKAARSANVLTLESEKEQLEKTPIENEREREQMRRGEETEVEYETEYEERETEQENDEQESEEMPELETEDEPEEARKRQNLERKKYLKEKEGLRENYSETIPRKKKLTKQERKIRRQTEERERNKKREREESKSPIKETPEENEERTKKRNDREESKSNEMRTETFSNVEIENPREEVEKRKENKKMNNTVENSKRNEEIEYWIYIQLEDRTFGEVKEILNRQYEVGTVSIIEKQECGTWGLMFKDRRFAEQAFKNGIEINGKRLFPMSCSIFKRGEKEEEKRYRFRTDSDVDKDFYDLAFFEEFARRTKKRVM